MQREEAFLHMHCKEILIYVFPGKELRGLSHNFHIHVAVSDLYIPTFGIPIFLQQNRQTDQRNMYFAHRNMNVFIGNICFKFSVLCLCSVQRLEETSMHMERTEDACLHMQRPEGAGVHVQRPEDARLHIRRPKRHVHMQRPEETRLPMQISAEAPVQVQRPEEADVHIQRPEEAGVHMQRPEEARLHMQRPEGAHLHIQSPEEANAKTKKGACICRDQKRRVCT
jgi:hypothetical protein